MGTTSLVWFKRDLRVRDHAPLRLAAERGKVICLYIYETELLKSPEWDSSHSVFIDDCLAELEDELAKRGASLVYRVGSVVDVFENLRTLYGFTHLFSHRETGNKITYDRDLQVGAWCRENGISWTETPQDGVIRRLKKRDGWAKRWQARMSEAIQEAPGRIDSVSTIDPERRRNVRELGLPPCSKEDIQQGGEHLAHNLLDDFFAGRGVNYRADMSSPLMGWNGCSRMSPYLAWGAISMRQVYRRVRREASRLQIQKGNGKPVDPRWLPSISSLSSRLSWHCHFMQKLEDEPDIEFKNMHRSYDGLRIEVWKPGSLEEQRFAAFCEGKTGYPMVDACVRALLRSGWVNFRMRAMLVSFASYHLWLHWKPTATFLAKHFLDFEPGIHFSQVQMQSGTTGINAVRIYSPSKQVVDQDPKGIFIKEYLPELLEVPPQYIAEPHKMSLDVQQKTGCIIGKDYPAPIVEHSKAYREARTKLGAVRRTDEARKVSQAVFKKHGSRKGPVRNRSKRNR